MTTLPVTDWKAVRHWVMVHPEQGYEACTECGCPLAIVLADQWKKLGFTFIRITNMDGIQAREFGNYRHRPLTGRERDFINEIDTDGRIFITQDIVLIIMDRLHLGIDYTETAPDTVSGTFKVEL